MKERKLKYFELTVRKSVSLVKDIIEGMMPGSIARGGPKKNGVPEKFSGRRRHHVTVPAV